ncbi:hypothetical protein MUN84_04005 [Hymenobacter sp. 5516J-16]|uniref:Uncharacterized protein n=2 Tax=Hymenobacter TaxID=89966 RepID=A0ABY4J747_9BACT|nr:MULTISPECIES: hypothetical protein [Hymenobacter]UOQ77831.1 hypothetical protein MUN84_04005 [Hymenobacter sp. 5516J-16]UPL47808.1 hypothetical protein MWH26_11445 [Hymenobacter sublimis]GGG48520.1 hypothetical protein GCM10011378_25820 [Hymenobacter glacieicola]
MSKVLEEIDQALAGFDSGQGRPVAIELGERKYTQLVLDVAHLHADGGPLTHNTGRPLAYRGLEILRDDTNRDRVRVI